MLKTQERVNSKFVKYQRDGLYEIRAEYNGNIIQVFFMFDDGNRKEAYAYCMGKLICDARKKAKITQSELAERIGTNKSYISRIEKGAIEPSISTFCRIIEALGLRIEIVKPTI